MAPDHPPRVPAPRPPAVVPPTLCKVVDVFGNWRPVGKMDLALGIYNLFDERFRAHASVADYNHIPDWEGIAGVYEPGRNIRLTASIRF